ncbi:TonB-dependent receptor [Sphingomonas sp. VNH70]|uniref:TonB-dependent siderophore receptor n=1 Tax=Sphingomonas silueang TaxID=3156617 RepID=UPI0032B585A7
MPYRHLLLIAAATGVALAAPVQAQVAATAVPEGNTADEADGVEVVVTGQRRQYVSLVPTIEVPQSIQVLSGETLARAGITRLDNALDFAAGIARQNNFGGLSDGFACRGLAGDENTASNYLVNGFNAARGYGGARDTSNVDRIEVLKGPNSAIFGRGEPGCTVNIISKKPGFTRHVAGVLSYGSFGTVRSEADVNLPLSGLIAMRVTGAAEKGGSFRGLDYSKYTVTPSFLARLGDDSSISYELEYIRQAVPFDRGIATVDGNLRTIPVTRFLGEPGDGPVTVAALGHQAQLQHDFDPDWSLVLGVGYRDTSFRGYSTEAELAAGRQRLPIDRTTLSRQRRYRDYGTTDLTVRGELSGEFATFGLTHHLLVGADWNQYELHTRQNRYRPPTVASQAAGNLASGNRIDIFAPVYGRLAAVGPFQDLRERQFSYGVYFQDQVDVTGALKVRFGGRFDDFEQVVDNRIDGMRTGQTRTAFSPSVGAAYVVSDAVSLYASYGRGFRPNTGVDFRNQAFTPERTTSYEVGAKLAALNGRLTGTIALFRADKTNVLSADPVNSGFSLAVGKARSRGVEAELSGKLPHGFRLQANYAHIDAEVGQDAIDPNFGFALREGDPLLGIAKHAASVLLFNDFTLGTLPASLGVGVNYVGERLGETGYRFPDGSFFLLPSYTLTRVMASIEPTGHVRLQGEVTNLFDEPYFPGGYSRLWVMPGAPRQFMVRAGFSF